MPKIFELTSRLLFYEPSGSTVYRLAIGAPSSPVLSNALMLAFDTKISNLVAEDRVIYTRYADDLTFSVPRTGFLKDVIRNVKRTLRDLDYPHLQINEEKTTYITRKLSSRRHGLNACKRRASYPWSRAQAEIVCGGS
jgi:RNA-directed DNA polymerase